MKKIVALTMAVAMAATMLVGCGGSSAPASSAAPAASGAAPAAPAGATMQLSIAHCMSEQNPYHKGVTKFAELVEEKSGGRITFTVHPSGQLGGERDVAEGVSMGTIDCALCTNSVVVSLDSDLGVLDFPYLFESKEEAYAVFDGEFGQKLLASMDNAGIHGLAFMENGLRHLTTSKQVVTPADMAGMKIRTMENSIHMSSFNVAGANATPLAWADTYTALQQGTADGQENPLKAIFDGSIYEVNKYIALTGHFYTASDLIMNKNLWDSLSDEDKQIFTEAAAEATAYQRDVCVEREAEVIEKMKAAGTTFSEVDKSQWRVAMGGVYQDKALMDQYGDLLTEMLGTMGKQLSDFTG